MADTPGDQDQDKSVKRNGVWCNEMSLIHTSKGEDGKCLLIISSITGVDMKEDQRPRRSQKLFSISFFIENVLSSKKVRHMWN